MSTDTLTRHRLGRCELLRLSQPARLRVDEGTLWITLDLEPQDLLLEAGESYEHDGHTPLIASPLGGPAAFTTQAAAAAGRRRGAWPGWLKPRIERLLRAAS